MNLIKRNWTKTILIIVVAVTVGYYFGLISNKSKTPQAYIFDSKTFFDNNYMFPESNNFKSVYVAGTLTGDGNDGNNTTSLTCYKDSMECLVSAIHGISESSCQLGRLDAVQRFPIVKWDDYVIIATDETPYDTFSCFKTTINIDRKSEVVEWVQEPINQSQLSCKDISDNKVYKWTIEDPKWMKDFKTSLKK